MKRLLLLLLLLPQLVFATVSVETARVDYSCDGIATDYNYPFKVLEDDDILATVTDASGVESTLVLNTAYTVVGAGSASGNISLTSAETCDSGESLSITRAVETTQDTDYVDGEIFSAESMEDALDKTHLILQQMTETQNRTLRFPVGTNKSGVLPDSTASTRAGKAVGFDSNGDLSFLTNVSASAVSTTPVAGSVVQYDASGNVNAENIIHRIDTLAALKGSPTGAGYNSAQTLGYSSAGDGGGALWFFNGADLSAQVALDTQSVIYAAPTADPSGASGAWVKHHNGIFYDKECGLKSDGTTDDSTALQATIDVLTTINGTLKLTGFAGIGAEVSFKSNVRFLGTDRFQTGFKRLASYGDATTDTPPDNMTFVDGEALTDVVLENLTFDQNEVNARYWSFTNEVTRFDIKGCRFINYLGASDGSNYSGLYFASSITTPNTHVNILDSEFRASSNLVNDATHHDAFSVVLKDAQHVRIHNCYMYKAKFTLETTTEFNVANTYKDLKISFVTFDSTDSSNLLLRPFGTGAGGTIEDFSLSNLVFKDAGIYEGKPAIRIAEGVGICRRFSISNIVVDGFGDSAISIGGGGLAEGCDTYDFTISNVTAVGRGSDGTLDVRTIGMFIAASTDSSVARSVSRFSISNVAIYDVSKEGIRFIDAFDGVVSNIYTSNTNQFTGAAAENEKAVISISNNSTDADSNSRNLSFSNCVFRDAGNATNKAYGFAIKASTVTNDIAIRNVTCKDERSTKYFQHGVFNGYGATGAGEIPARVSVKDCNFSELDDSGILSPYPADMDAVNNIDPNGAASQTSAAVLITGTTDETDLVNHTIPDQTLWQSQMIRLAVDGAVSGAAGTKTLRWKVGGSTIFTQAVTGDWQFEAYIARTASRTSHRLHFKLWDAGALVAQGYAESTADASNDVAMVFTGQLSNSGDAIVAHYHSLAPTGW